jgi:hypothetical protein
METLRAYTLGDIAEVSVKHYKPTHAPKVRLSDIKRVAIKINGVCKKLVELSNADINKACLPDIEEDKFEYRTDRPYDRFELWYIANYKLKTQVIKD